MRVHTKASDQAHLRFGVHSYPIDHPDRYALGLLATILGGGMSSRLFTEVRERRGLAYYVYGYNQGYTDTGTLFAQAGVDIARIDDAIQDDRGGVREDRCRGGGLGRAREGPQLRQGTARALAGGSEGDGHVRVARRGAREPVREPDEVLAGFDAVTAGDVQRVARDHHPRGPAEPRADRAVRGVRALRAAAGALRVAGRGDGAATGSASRVSTRPIPTSRSRHQPAGLR